MFGKVGPVNDDMRWSKYIDATCNDAKNTEIARKVGVDPATVGRWRTGSTDPNPRQVVAYARAFGRSAAEALVAAGYLTADEVGVPIQDVSADPLAGTATTQLLREAIRRIEADETNVTGVAEDDDYDVSDAPAASLALAAKKGRKKADQ